MLHTTNRRITLLACALSLLIGAALVLSGRLFDVAAGAVTVAVHPLWLCRDGSRLV